MTFWGNADSCDEFMPSNYGKDITLRYTITAAVPGNKIRLKFSNAYGCEDVTLSKVTLGNLCDDGSVCNITPVNFSGKREALICKGEHLYSDDIELKIAAKDKLAVSIYLSDFTDMNSCIKTMGPLTNNVFAKGDFTESAVIDSKVSEAMNSTYFLCGADVMAADNAKAVIAFGDSITAQSWPEWLSLRLMEDGREDITIVRKGISGSRVLREYTNLSLIKYGHAGISRFEKDVLSVCGAKRVLVLHGINDIIHPTTNRKFRPLSDLPTPDDIIEGYKKYIEIAHKHGLEIYFATITPFCGWSSYDDSRNLIRLKVNDWIRSNTLADGYIDYDKTLRDPHNSVHLAVVYDSGDHLHPSLEGGNAIAHSIPEALLK